MLRRHLTRFWRDESGQSVTEYILIIGLISIPVYIAFAAVFRLFLRDFISAIIGSFTRG